MKNSELLENKWGRMKFNPLVFVCATFIGMSSLAYAFGENYSSADQQIWDIKSLRSEAEKGNPEAQYRLGRAFDNGEGVPLSKYEAVIWYKKAASGGNADAQVVLGTIYRIGIYGVPQDKTEAYYLYRQAALQGNVSAQATIANMLWDGDGAIKDRNESVNWYTKAAQGGDADSQVMLGVIYRDGLGVKIDYTESVKWLKKAARQGHPSGQFALGMMYSVGKGVPKNEKEAEYWFARAENARPDTRWDISWMLRMKGLIKNDEEK